MERDVLLAQVKRPLSEAFADRLKGVVLYGSEVRGNSDADSDVDLLVLLDGPVVLARDLRTIIDALYPLQLEIARPLHATPVDVRSYEAGAFALYRNAKREGMTA